MIIEVNDEKRLRGAQHSPQSHLPAYEYIAIKTPHLGLGSQANVIVRFSSCAVARQDDADMNRLFAQKKG